MNHSKIHAACLAALAVLSAPSSLFAQEQPEKFEARQYSAAGDWSVSHNSYACTIERPFERSGETVRFTMRRVHPGSGIQYGLFAKGMDQRPAHVVAGFIPSAGPLKYTELASASMGDTPGFVFAGPDFWEINKALAEGGDRSEVGRKHRDLVANTTHFVAQGLTDFPLALKTGGITEALKALDQCVAERLAEMGITAEILETTKVYPSPRDGEAWAGEIGNVYPREALRNGFDGLVEMRVVVASDGSPTHCHVANQMIAQTLREAACAAMLEHSRFDPARNAEGESVPGLYFQSVRYVIPAPPNADGSRAR